MALLPMRRRPHYHLQINIVPAEERMAGTAEITLSNVSAAALREIPFVLYRLLAYPASSVNGFMA